MKRMFYIIAVVLAFSWVMSYFIFHAGAQVHILVLLAVICWLHAIITMPQKKYILGEMEGRIGEETPKKQRA